MRFFFRLSAERGSTDDEGVELDSLKAAKTEAFRFLGDTLRDYAVALPHEDELKLTVCDSDGVTLLTFTLLVDEPVPLQRSVHSAERLTAIA